MEEIKPNQLPLSRIFPQVGALECQMFQKTNQLVSLSEQQLVDCAFTTGNNGCSGGWVETAFLYVMNNGLQTEESYPYEKKVSLKGLPL